METENRPDTNGVCEPFVVLTQEIWELLPMQIGNGTPGALKQLLPPCPASPTSSLPLKKATPRGLSSPVAIVVTDGAAAAGIASNAATTPAPSTPTTCPLPKSHSSLDPTPPVSPVPPQ